MRAGSTAGGRGLWPLVLLMTVALVAADFLRQPLHGPEPGVAAPPGHELVLWVSSVDAETGGERLARAAAERLDRPWRPVTLRRVRGGGSATAVTTLLGRRPGGTPPLLLVDAGTVADVERDRRGSPLPVIADDAQRAATLLRDAVPIAILAEDPLVVAATGDDGLATPAQLFAAMRRDPGAAVFGLAQDSWSKTALAALVHAVGVNGDVRYRLLPTADAAVVERAGDLADVIVAPRSELHALPLSGRLRLLASSGAGRSAPAAGSGRASRPLARLGDLLPHGSAVAHAQRWVALVAPPGTNARVRRSLTRQLQRMAASDGWQRTLRQLAFAPAAARRARPLPPRGTCRAGGAGRRRRACRPAGDEAQMTQPRRRREAAAPLDADDFTALYRRYAQPLLLFFQRRVHDPELATDLMGELFAVALDRRAQYRGSDESELSGWLWAIARSTLRDHERRDVTERRGAQRLGVERRALTDREIERIEELAGLAQLRQLVATRLAELPEDQRTAVTLRVIDDLPYKDVAARMGVRIPTARAHVSRALRRLSRELLDRDLVPHCTPTTRTHDE